MLFHCMLRWQHPDMPSSGVIVKNMQLHVSIMIIEMCLIVIDTLFNEITIMYRTVSQNATYHSQKY